MRPVRLLLCTDLDRTLLPNGPQPESPGARERFRALVAHPQIMLVYVTGRDRGRVEQAMSCFDLPTPDFVISDVGTNIFDLRAGRWASRPDWQAEIAPCWNGYSRERIHGLLESSAQLRLQERDKQSTYKLSYYVDLDADRSRADATIAAKLTRHGIQASLIWSIDEPASVGLLDVLPLRATKLHAVQFLRNSLGIPLDRSLFAGDSGNDLLLLASDTPSVLVANALPTVVQQAVAAAAQNGHGQALHLARGGVLGMNGNYAAGILEGVAHFHPDIVGLFADGTSPFTSRSPVAP